MASGPLPEFFSSIYDRWCRWSLQKNDRGKLTKVPDCSTLDSSGWRDVEWLADLPRSPTGGIGLIFTRKIDYPIDGGDVGVLLALDLDSCVDPEGKISDWALEIVRAVNSYTELSPSRTGLRVLFVTDNEAELEQLSPKTRIIAAGVNGKKPEVQVFGMGPAGYVTITGDALPDFSELRYRNLEALLSELPHLRASKSKSKPLAPGEGPVPSMDEITEAVLDHVKGGDLIRGNWHLVTPNASASEAYHILAGLAVDGARRHGDAAVAWLLSYTSWGRGEVENSADPDRYGRESWVAAEVRRILEKGAVVSDAADVFEPLGEDPDAPDEVEIQGEKPKKQPLTLRDVVEGWQQEGPLVHLPTGIDALDDLTGGGPVLGSRVYLIGAPDAGKTALLVQIMDTYLARGIPCAILAVDEEAGDLAMRMLQRRGFDRADCERRSPEQLVAMLARVTGGREQLWLYGPEWTIEEMMADFAGRSGGHSPAGERVCFIDSMQTVRSSGEQADDSTYLAVTERVRAVRAGATRYRMLAIATSEMSRAAYRSRKSEENQSDMASAKESGAIEYSARVLLALRSVPGASDEVELRVVKNKHGRSHRNDEHGIFLRMNRATQVLTEDSAFEPVDPAEEAKAEARAEREQLKAEKAKERLLGAWREAWELFSAVFDSGSGIGRNEAMRVLGWGSKRVYEDALGHLTAWGVVEVVPGANRSSLVKVSSGAGNVPEEALKVREEVLGW